MASVSKEELQLITRRIVDAIKPEKIYMFGSRAWGTPSEDSDIDIFIIVADSDQPAYKRARAVYKCLRGINVPVEVIVQTHEEVENSRDVRTSLARKVLEDGTMLYG